VFEIFKMNKKKKELEHYIDLLDFKIQELYKEIDSLETKEEKSRKSAESAEIAAKEAQSVLNALNGKIHTIEEMQDYNIPYYQDSLDELEHKRYELQSKIESAVNTGLYRIEQGYTLNDSARRGKEMQDVYGRGLCYAMSEYIDNKEKSITTSNIAKSKELIKNKFNSYQSKANKVGLALNAEYVKARLDMLYINLAIKVKQKEEKARIREEKRRLKEQEQLLADIARERAKLLEEKKAMNIAFDKALTDDERNRIKSQLASIDKRLDSIAYRESHSKAGWLYVISSPSLPGLVKLGCTRRLNPALRVRELSSSSLPEPYHAHCFVFSDDCFELENNIHKYFDKERVNPDREFFRIEPKEAIDVLKEIFNVDVHFVDENCDENEEDE
jgi:DNA-binding ferritin-like protein